MTSHDVCQHAFHSHLTHTMITIIRESIPGLVLGVILCIVSLVSLVVIELGRIKKDLKIYNIVKNIVEVEPTRPPPFTCIAHIVGTLVATRDISDPVFTNLTVSGALKIRRVTEVYVCSERVEKGTIASDHGMGPGVAVVQQQVSDHNSDSKPRVTMELEWSGEPEEEMEPLRHFKEYSNDFSMYNTVEQKGKAKKVVYNEDVTCGSLSVPVGLVRMLCNSGSQEEVLVTKLPAECVIHGLHRVGHFYTNIVGGVPRIGDVRVSFYIVRDNVEASSIAKLGGVDREMTVTSSSASLDKLESPLLDSLASIPQEMGPSRLSLSALSRLTVARIYHPLTLLRCCASKGWRVGSYWSIKEGKHSATSMLEDLHNDKRHLITISSRVAAFLFCYIGSFLVCNPFWCFIRQRKAVGPFLRQISTDGVWAFALYTTIMQWCGALFLTYLGFRPLLAFLMFTIMIFATLCAVVF